MATEVYANLNNINTTKGTLTASQLLAGNPCTRNALFLIYMFIILI